MITIPGRLQLSGKQSVRSAWRSAAQEIVSLDDQYRELDDEQLRKESLSLRYEVLSGEPVERIIVPGFALVREAARRRLGMQHYPVQLIGGIAMTHGAIAVMQTGEGKTLTASLPLYLAALAGKGAHLATANDYLAARDANLMRPLFELLGLSVGVVEQPTERSQRREAYAADITYSTSKEIGFDFLRDRLLLRSVQDAAIAEGSINGEDSDSALPVQRNLHFMLVDEADSILIDEARTPLIISSLPDDLEARRALYQWSAAAIASLVRDRHFEFDQETRSVALTGAGRTAVRKLSTPGSLCHTPLVDIYDQIELALLVEEKFSRDRHYVVRDGEVVIVDEFTGRMAEGRKWRAGLHQAIEAREGLDVTAETAEAARITVQDLFLKYASLCGMTGTVASSGRELYSIYETPVVNIPTNKPPRRTQYEDRVFGTDEARWLAIVDEVKELHAQNRPVLVGTRSIDKSERLSELLQEAGIEHQVLNARHLESEAEIVAAAGEASRVTVATNMAGRGTDIKLSAEALAAGGLHVIISELHESARIDRQLIGRCGRQGDPGSYRFYMSLEDDILLAGLGGSMAERLQADGRRKKLQPSSVARLFRKAQSRVEARHFHGRKMLLVHERNRQTAQRELGQDPYVDTIS